MEMLTDNMLTEIHRFKCMFKFLKHLKLISLQCILSRSFKENGKFSLKKIQGNNKFKNRNFKNTKIYNKKVN